ncbi:MAG: hypothetical protein M3276_05355, partial [Actinomycetota bacterium]|nr:hypothetical protein [Actinomycetota bacterium]
GVASALAGRRLPLAVAARLPAVFATMHHAWGAGFLSRWRAAPRRAGPGVVHRLATKRFRPT